MTCLEQHTICVDMGTTNTRVWLLCADQIVASAKQANGVRVSASEGSTGKIIAVLQEMILEVSSHGGDGHQPSAIAAAGMITSSLGLSEIPHVTGPAGLSELAGAAQWHNFREISNLPFLLVPGIRIATENNSTVDVMRGEETMLLGCDINDDEYLSIFPGTHSKHVVVKDGRLVDFKTFMTGEIFDLLANKSVLSKSIKNNDGQYQTVFEAGVKAGANNNLLNIAFHVRTNALFKKYTPEENYHNLSGLLIGYELSEIDDLKKNIRLVCGKQLAAKYLQAFKILSPQIKIENINADDALINGHCKLAAIYYNY